MRFTYRLWASSALLLQSAAVAEQNRSLIAVPSAGICEDSGVELLVADDHYQAGVINILKQSPNSDEVIFTVSQTFDAGTAWMSVVYTNADGEAICNQQENTVNQHKKGFKAKCDGGSAYVDVYAHVDGWSSSGDRLNPSSSADLTGSCASWTSNVDMFSYKIDCTECGGGCTLPPVDIPIDPNDQFCESDGISVIYKDDHYKTGAIKIMQQTDTEVVFTVDQIYETGDWMTVVSQDSNDDWVCDQSTDTPFPYKRSFKAKCDAVTGMAKVDVYVNNQDGTSANKPAPDHSSRHGKCDAWVSEGEGNTNVALVVYEVACGTCGDGCRVASDAPTLAPTPGPAAVPVCQTDMGETGSTVCPGSQAVEVVSIKASASMAVPHFGGLVYDIKMGGSPGAQEVSFRVDNPFDFDVDMYVRYDGRRGIRAYETECYKELAVPGCALEAEEIKAACMNPPGNQAAFALLSIYFVSNNPLFGGDSGVEIFECCYPENENDYPVVEYTLMVNCECPSTISQRNLRAVNNVRFQPISA